MSDLVVKMAAIIGANGKILYKEYLYKENYKQEKSSKGVNIKNGPHFPTVYGSNGNDGATVSGQTQDTFSPNPCLPWHWSLPSFLIHQIVLGCGGTSVTTNKDW